jgi:hypothetical protein
VAMSGLLTPALAAVQANAAALRHTPACYHTRGISVRPIRPKSAVALDLGPTGRRDVGPLFRRSRGPMLGDEVGLQNVGLRARGGEVP